MLCILPCSKVSVASICPFFQQDDFDVSGQCMSVHVSECV